MRGGRVLGVSAWIALASCAPAAKVDPACTRASDLRGEARGLAADGRLVRALSAIEDANQACPGSRSESWGVEVELLGQLGRCNEMTPLADAIDAAAWRGDGAWLSSAVARDACAKATSVDAGAVLDDATARFDAGDLPGARRRFARGIAAAGTKPRADFIRWTHKEPGPMAWVGGDALLVVDQEHASLLSTRDWHELMSFDGRTPIHWVAVSPSGRVAVTVDASEIKVWELDHQRLRAIVDGDGPVALSDDTLAFVRNRAVVTIDVATGRRKGSMPIDAPTAMARTPSGFAVTGKHTLAFFDESAHAQRSLTVPWTTASMLLSRPDGSLFVAHDDPRQGEAGLERVTPNGAIQRIGEPWDVVRGGSPDGQWLVMDADTEGARQLRLVRPGERRGVDLGVFAARAIASPDGSVVVFRDDKGLHRLDVRNDKDRIVIPTVTVPLEEMRVVANGDAIAVRGLFQPNGHLWTTAGPVRVPAFDRSNWTVGEELIVAEKEGVYDVVEARTGAVLRHGDADAKDRFFIAADGSRVLLAGTNRHRFVDPWGRGADLVTMANGERDVGFDPSNASLLITRADASLEWHAVPSLDLVRSMPFEGSDVSILRGAGEPAALTSRNGRSAVVSLETGRVLLDAVRVRNSVLARRSDSSFLRVGRKDDDSSRSPLYIFDAQGNADAGFALYPHECESFDAPADGRWIAASCKEGSIVVWSIETHAIALVLRPFPGLDSGYALEPTTGKVEIFGHPPLAPICRAGARSLPFEACDDVVEPGLVARVLGFPQ